MDIWIVGERYRVERRVARWPLVEVYVARDVETDDEVRVKCFAPRLAEDIAFVEVWRDQVAAVQALEVPCVVPILASGELPDGGLYQVEAMPAGVRLATWAHQIAGGDPLQAVRLVELVARHIGDVHEQGVAHGALHPGAIFLSESPDGEIVPRFADWELRALAEAGVVVPAVAGYLAPEPAPDPEQPHSPAADVYALGLILYELLTGESPYPEMTHEPMARRQMALVPPRRYNPAVPPAVERVVMLALSADPARRPPHGRAMARALQEAMSAPPSAAAVSSALNDGGTQHRESGLAAEEGPRPMALWAAVGALVVAVAVVAALLVWRVDRPAERVPAAGVVPNVEGLPLDEAQDVARLQGLRVEVVEERPGSGPPGLVVAQTPVPGGLVPEDRTVRVVISAEAPPVAVVTVPDVFGMSTQQAAAVLEEAGLRVGQIRRAHDAAVPAGLVLEQNPRAGVTVASGTAVDLIVSAGPPPGQ